MKRRGGLNWPVDDTGISDKVAITEPNISLLRMVCLLFCLNGRLQRNICKTENKHD